MMQIALVRHAIAEERSAERADSDRRLTSKGITRFRKVVEGLEVLGVSFDRVLYSPWTRAEQTAELLAPLVSGRMIECDDLAADPGDELLEVLANQPRGERIALIGHEPWMTELLGILCFGSPRHGGNIRFKKGGVALLEGEPGHAGMDLLGFLPPRVLRKLA